VLESVNLPNNPDLTRIYLYENQLTSIDVSQNPNLRELGLSNNKIVSLDVSNNLRLETLQCGDNLLTGLNISKNTNLKNLAINNMPTLLQVCVWTIPLTGFNYIDNSGSPNMFLSLDCNK
jgi:Leucine-rich repeat (LRR) protein